MQGILYEEPSVWQFLFITVIMGGWTAWRTGKSVAEGWQPYRALVIYILLLGVAIRFIHHALFNGTMLTVQYYIVDTAVLLLFATLGYRYYRTRQMTNNYYWLYEKVSPFSWKSK
jgi:small-conductance mechanosensitive channel